MKMKTLAAAFGILLAFSSGHAQTPAPSPQQGLQTAIFGGGCFWCVEEFFDHVPGVTATISGYSGGDLPDPTYDDVSEGGSGHVEVVQVTYDPARTSYRQLLDVFWRNIDPVAPNRQFCDRGPQYRSVIFYQGDQQRREAEASLAALQRSGRFDRPIVTEILPAKPFYRAEGYHQDYYRKNPVSYRLYKFGCGRSQRLEAIWGSS
jgi:peptide-methionine (S)-S-oxide reductase